MHGKSFDGGEVINPHAYKPREPLSEEEKRRNRLAEADRKERILMAREEPAAKRRYKEATRKQREGKALSLKDQVAIARYQEIKKKFGL